MRKPSQNARSLDRRRLKGEGTRSHIIDVAKTLFVRHGYDGVSMREITLAAKVNVASIHYHFGSKEELLFETLRRSARPLIEQRMQALKDLPRPYRLEDLVLAFVRPVFGGERAPVRGV